MKINIYLVHQYVSIWSILCDWITQKIKVEFKDSISGTNLSKCPTHHIVSTFTFQLFMMRKPSQNKKLMCVVCLDEMLVHDMMTTLGTFLSQQNAIISVQEQPLKQRNYVGGNIETMHSLLECDACLFLF